MYKCITFLLSLCAYMARNGLSAASANITVLSLSNCDDEHVKVPENFICQTEIITTGSETVFNAEINLPFDLDDSLMYNCNIKRLIGNSWKPLKLTLKGRICEHIHKYLPGIWEKLSKTLNIPSNCPIKAGKYSVKDFTAESSGVNLPIVIPGKYRISTMILKDDIPILCKNTEIIIG